MRSHHGNDTTRPDRTHPSGGGGGGHGNDPHGGGGGERGGDRGGTFRDTSRMPRSGERTASRPPPRRSAATPRDMEDVGVMVTKSGCKVKKSG